MAATHDMKLARVYYDLIAHGSKTIEIRVNDVKRQSLKTGDMIRFSCDDDSCIARIRRISRYPSFDIMLDHEEVACIHPNAVRQEQLASLREIYQAEKEQLGVLAIEITCD